MGDLHSLKTNEQTFVRNEVRILISFTQLITSERASRKDQDNSSAYETEEKSHAVTQRTSRSTAEVSPQVVSQDGAEENQYNNL